MLRVIGAREVRKCRKCDAMPSEGKKLQLPGTTCLKLWPCTRKSRCRSWGYSREAAVKITTVPLCAGQSKPEPRNQIIVYIARFFIHRKTIMICSASQRCRQLLNWSSSTSPRAGILCVSPCVYVYIYMLCLSVCVHVCMYICFLYVVCVYIYIYIYTYIYIHTCRCRLYI